ncbi:MAG: VOC family protein [Candidatus Thorarchaeota archaeon]|nr:VOC family protein [Candidatus Thorarchaeota archaeon]
MAGLVFLRTGNLEGIVEFYTSRLGMRIWLEQESCTLLAHGNFILGFCESEKPETEGVITLFYEKRDNVDEMYARLQDISVSSPVTNDRYGIYQFYAKDPEGRSLEFQTFLHGLQPIVVDSFLRGGDA